MTELPGVLAQIANVAGEDAALAIAEARGGTQVYIPPVPDADHWLCKLVGREAALAIADEFTGGFAGARVDLPLGPAGQLAKLQAQMRHTLDAMIAEGRSERDIALSTRYSARTIRRRRAQLGKDGDPNQLSLF